MITTDQTDMNSSTIVVSSTAPVPTMEDESVTTSSDTSTSYTPTTSTTKGATSTHPDGSLLTTSTNKPLINKNDDHFTTTDQTTGLVSEKDDLPIIFLDSKLAIILSATSLATVFALVVATFISLVVVVLLYMHIKQTIKESKSAKVKLTRMKEKPISPRHTMNTYASPIHDHCGEEKEDLM